MEYQFNPLTKIVEVFNDLYPSVYGEIVFVDGLHDEEGVFSGVQNTEELPAKIIVDSSVPISGVVPELVEQFSVLVCDVEWEDYEYIEEISNYIYQRYKQYVNSLIAEKENVQLH